MPMLASENQSIAIRPVSELALPRMYRKSVRSTKFEGNDPDKCPKKIKQNRQSSNLVLSPLKELKLNDR